MKFLLKLLITAVNAFVLAQILPGIGIDHINTAIKIALVLAVLDALVKPLFILLTFPVTVITLGMFLFVINACIVLTAEYFIDGFTLEGFWTAVLFSVVLSFLNSFVHKSAFGNKRQLKHGHA